MSRTARWWLLVACAEAALLACAAALWVLGFAAAPGFISPDNAGTLAGVWGMQGAAAALVLVVPGWLAVTTGVRWWWLAGALPAGGCLATAAAISSGW